MDDLEPKTKRMKMDEYSERKKIERRKKNPFPGTRGYGICSSRVLLSKNGIGTTNLPKVGREKRKRETYFNNLDQLSYSGKDKNSSIPDTEEDAVASSLSFKEYMETIGGLSCLQNVFEGIKVAENDVTAERPTKTWKERVESTENAWKDVFKSLLNDVLASQAFYGSSCGKCGCELANYAIRCNSCAIFYCGNCDLKQHETNLFHHRTLATATTSTHLLLHQFVNANGELFSKDIPVLCFRPQKCSNCECQNQLEILPGDEYIAAITKDGRFDLKSTRFSCSNCKFVEKASIVDYICSGFWPGDPNNISYLFSVDLLRFWYLTKHNMPGTSLNKFLETLEMLFEGFKPFKPINKIHFQNASRHYEYFIHLIDSKIKLRDKKLCFSCKGSMLASHPDGNFKLYRLLSATGLNQTSLYGNAVIAYDEDMEKHQSLIDSKLVKSKSSETCGDSIFKAARSDAGKHKKLDETGIMMRTCRHGIVDKAVNMHQGETFRHTHFMHVDLPEKKCSFLCGDVICRYWKWAQKVALLFPEFKSMTEDMKPFLGRMHAKVHVWYCQILWVGHWMLNAALTLGEEQEQVFSKMSRYGSVTKHMGKANRRDHITAAVLFWNVQKEKGMVHQLVKRRERALNQIKVSSKQLKSDFENYHLKSEELPRLLEELRKTAEEYKAGRKKNKDAESPLEMAQKTLEGYNAHIKILKSRVSRIATTSGQRIKIRKAMMLLSKKITELVAFITTNSKYNINKDHLLNGHFPWQNSEPSTTKTKMTFHEQFQIIDNWMLLLRSKEEVLQSEKEMRNFVNSIMEQKVLLETETKSHVSLITSTSSTLKEYRIAQQKAVLISQELARLNEMLTSAVTTFHEIDEQFVDKTGTRSLISPTSKNFIREETNNEHDYNFSDLEILEDSSDEETSDNWSDNE